MESDRFDAWTKALADGVARRRVLRGLGGGLAGAVLTGLGLRSASAVSGGQSACAAFCAQVFGDTKAAGQCTSQAAHGQGLCYQCGPGGGTQQLCGTSCIPAAACCGGCPSDQTCAQGRCCTADGAAIPTAACSAPTPCTDSARCGAAVGKPTFGTSPQCCNPTSPNCTKEVGSGNVIEAFCLGQG